MSSLQHPETDASPDERYRRLFESLADAVFVVDAQTRQILEVNATAAQMHGYTREELNGMAAPSLVAPRSEGNPSYGFHERKNGTRFPVEITANAVAWGERKAELLLVRDLTDRQATEAALGESQALLDSAFNKTPLLMSIVDLSTNRYLQVNQRFCSLMGFTQDEMIGRTAIELGLITPAEGDALAQKLMASAGNAIDLVIRSKAGQPIACRYWGSVVPTAEGLKLFAAAEDVTEIKRLQTNLAQADRLASMGMLAAGVAHEINNPLAYVVANLDTLVRELPRLTGLAERSCAALITQLGQAALDSVKGDGGGYLSPAGPEELLSSAASALEGARRIAKISGGLGTFARVERGEFTNVDVNRAVDVAVTMASNEAKYRATITREFGDLPRVRATEGKLAQVFLNLIINAAHAIPEGNAERHRITVRTFGQDDQVFIEVADTGTGIAPEHLERIFEPFFTTKQVGAGSGLGLSISKSLITEFGGDIRVESTVGAGTRVIVRLPASLTTTVTPLPAASPVPGPRVRGRILIVDDEAPIRRVLLRLLAPHEVIALGSGTEAAELLARDQAFDLILCDLMMPEMTGMELHGWIQTNAPALLERVVFISGGAFTPSAEQFLASVSNIRLEKPFNPTGLLQLADELVVAARKVG